MKKKEIGPQPMIWLHPTVLVGTNVDGKPDISKFRPFAFGPGGYYPIGEVFAEAFKIGWEINSTLKKANR
jgi:hypothetical protein